MTSERFYADLPVISDFGAVTIAGSYAALPDDWHVALCDVRNSTAAVEAGKYKNVNTIGAAAITAVLNAAGELDIPFSFEGDGCVLCVPPRLLDDTRAALAKTQEIARDGFGLELRIATVPVARIREAQKRYKDVILVAFGSPYVLRQVPDVGGFVCAWGEDLFSQRAAAKALTGAIEYKGALPVDLGVGP